MNDDPARCNTMSADIAMPASRRAVAPRGDDRTAERLSRLRVLNSAPPSEPRFRPFFVASLTIGLLAGAAWGVVMLVEILVGGRFTSVSIYRVNAHGHAQVYGFVGLLILGFAYEAFPRLWSTSLPAPRLRRAVFIGMLVGIALHVVGWWLGTRPWSAWLSGMGGVIETLALATFASQIVMLWARASVPFGISSLFILVATGLMVLHAAAETVYSVALAGVGSRSELLALVSVWQAPLRNLQLHGSMLLMIVGVGMQMLSRMFSLPTVPARRQAWVFGLLLSGMLSESIAGVLLRLTGRHQHAASLMLAWVGMGIAVALVVGTLRPWRVWRDGVGRMEGAPRFIRAALGWLVVWIVLLLLMPLHRWLSGLDFSHAYYGATRHALAGGFATFMMLGFVMQVVPSALGMPDRTPLAGARHSFKLLMIGCGGHVTLQLVADSFAMVLWALPAFAVMELLAIAWVAVPMLGRLLRSPGSNT